MKNNKLCNQKGIQLEIKKWYKSKEQVLNIVLEPYSSLDMVKPLINDTLKRDKKVLYITKNKIKEISKIGKEAYIEYGLRDIFNKEEYELLIYDDITFYNDKSRLECFNELMLFLKKAKKIIIFSIEEISENIRVLEIYNTKSKGHFVEPRVISTKVNLKKNMPYMLYEYMEWFRQNNKPVIIYVPTKEKEEDIYSYYKTKLKIKEPIKTINESYEKTIKNASYKNKNIIIITKDLHKYFDVLKDINIIFYFSDDKFFDYKKIVFACGALKREKNYSFELLLVCNEENHNIEKAKYISRRFNKLLWEN